MLINLFKTAYQGYKDIKEITKPIAQTVKIGLSSAGIVELSKEEENLIIEQLMIEELIREQQQAPNSPYKPNKPLLIPKANLTPKDTLYHLPRLKKNSLEYILGHDESGKLIIQDLEKEPHLIIGGKTGSGKTVSEFNILISLTYSNTPNTLKISLIDPKILSFGDHRILNSPFLQEEPSIGDNQKALGILKSAYHGMMNRYRAMQQNRVKDYRKIGLYAHVIFIDELAELVEDTNKKEILKYITQIASLGRQAGVHFVIGTQSIRAEILGGSLKANLEPIGLLVSNSTESKILELPKAHKLKGHGDGYKKLNGENTITHFQATYIDIESDITYQTLLSDQTQTDPNSQPKPPKPQPTPPTQTTVNMGLSGGIEINLNTQNSHKRLIDKILSSANDKGKIAPKKQLINLNSRAEREEFEKVIKELLQDNKIYFVNGKGYYLKTTVGAI